MSCSSKLIKPKEGVVGTSNLQLVGQRPRWQPGLATGIWNVCVSGAVVWGRRQSLVGLKPLPCGIWCHLWVDSVRAELNCRTPAGVTKTCLLLWRKPSTHLVTKGSEMKCPVWAVKETHREETHRWKMEFFHYRVPACRPLPGESFRLHHSSHFSILLPLFLKKLINLLIIIYFLAALGLRRCTRAFSSCGECGLLFIAEHGL